MNFPDALFPQSWALGAILPVLMAWLWCLRTAPWRRLADSGQLNVWLGTIVMLTLAWSLKAGVKPGLSLHLLGATMVTLSAAEAVDGAESAEAEVLAVHDALNALAALDERQARVVELKFFGGLDIEEIASLLSISSATVRRDWTMARLWLGRALAA